MISPSGTSWPVSRLCSPSSQGPPHSLAVTMSAWAVMKLICFPILIRTQRSIASLTGPAPELLIPIREADYNLCSLGWRLRDAVTSETELVSLRFASSCQHLQPPPCFSLEVPDCL